MASAVDDQHDEAGLAVDIAPTRPSGCVKVLHLVNGDLYAGAEQVQDLLAGRMHEFGYEMGFACLKPGRFASDRRCQQAPLVNVPMRFKFDLLPARNVAKVIRKGNYQILHTHSPRTAMVGRVAAALARVPMVHHLHSPAAAEYKQVWKNQFNARIERMTLWRVAALIAVSNSVADYARSQGLPADRITVVHNGVPTQSQLVPPPVEGGEWTLGAAALFRPRKGIEVLVEALALLRDQGLPVRLRAVGAFYTPEYETFVKSRVAELKLEGAIDWVGFTRDVLGEMRKMNLFVLPSLFGEGLPMVVLEAMSVGVPVVGTRVEGVPEALRDGTDGLLVEPNNPVDLAQAIARIVRGEVDWSELRHTAHRRQASEFSDLSMTAGVARVYDQVLNR